MLSTYGMVDGRHAARAELALDRVCSTERNLQLRVEVSHRGRVRAAATV